MTVDFCCAVGPSGISLVILGLHVGWEGQLNSWDMSGWSLVNPGTVGFRYCTVGHSGISLVVLGLHVGWEGQWDSGIWDVSSNHSSVRKIEKMVGHSRHV